MIESWLPPLQEAFGPPGREERVRQVLEKALTRLGVNYLVDHMGNLIVETPRSTTESPLITCGMDVPGLLLLGQEESGRCRLELLGDLDAGNLEGTVVVTESGRRGLMVRSSPGEEHPRNVGELRVDFGVNSEGIVDAHPSGSDRFAVFSGNTDDSGPQVGLNNRLSCALLLDMLRHAWDRGIGLQAVFSVQEQLQGRGSQAMAGRVQAGCAVCLGPAWSGGADSQACSPALGGGPVLHIRAGSFVSHQGLIGQLEQAAQGPGLSLQRATGEEPFYGAGALQLARCGMPVAGVGVPLRPPGGPMALYDSRDFEGLRQLLFSFLEHYDVPPGPAGKPGAG